MVDAMAKIIEEKMKSYKMEVSDVIEAIVKDVIDVKEEMSQCMARIEKMSKTPADKKISTFNTEVKEDKFDAIEARIETLKNIRAGKI
jgi:GTPase involved in cell partitioning and DNA repair